MDHEPQVVNEAVADLHKALRRQTSSANTGGDEAKSGRDYGSAPNSSTSAFCVRRSISEPVVQPSAEASRLKTPGGFRRDFLNARAEDSGVPVEERPKAWQQSFLERLQPWPLTRAGYFEALGLSLDPDTGEVHHTVEERSTELQTAIALFKSFVAAGVTFLPHAFAEGGWFFCSLLLLCIAGVSFSCIGLLLDCRRCCDSSSYPEIAAKAMGNWGRLAVQVSLVLSQFGVCIAYFIFVSTLMQSIGLMYGWAAIFFQFAFVAPLCLIKSVRHLEIPNLLADALIMLGLGVVLYYSICSLRLHGISPDVRVFRPNHCGVAIGTMIYMFEGIPMMLPIRNAMQAPEQFWSVLSKVFAGITCFFLSFGLLCYLRLGLGAQTVVLLNLPNDQLSVAVKLGYMIALLLSLPLMFLPASRIMDLWLFSSLPKDQLPVTRGAIKLLQMSVLAFCAFCGRRYFDKLLAIVGAFCAAPIAFVYPGLCHMALCAQSRAMKMLDVGFVIFGVVCMIATLKFL